MKILIVDDDPIKIHEIEKAIKESNIQVEFVETRNVSEGYNAFVQAAESGEFFDLIISDNYMPLRGGESPKPNALLLTNDIRRIEERKNYPKTRIVVCSSGSVSDGDYNYFVRYDISVDMSEKFAAIIKR